MKTSVDRRRLEASRNLVWQPLTAGKSPLTEYRPFRNSDPPQLVELWDACELGRGAVRGIRCDILDTLVFAEPYWDRMGLIVAVSDGVVVGFVHAGFGANEQESALSREIGVICAVMVHPDFRRRGIGRELIARAERYLGSFAVKRIEAGETPGRNPFYLGLYGGSNSAGFLESDCHAAPFMAAVGYRSDRRFLVFQRSISQQNDPFDVRMVGIRRTMELVVSDRPHNATWWWLTRQGRFDSIRFLLQPKQGGDPVAELTCWGLDLFAMAWRERAVGFTKIIVSGDDRQKGFAKTIVVEAIRRLREEMVSVVEVHVEESNLPTISLLESLKFEQVDLGVAYVKQA